MCTDIIVSHVFALVLIDVLLYQNYLHSIQLQSKAHHPAVKIKISIKVFLKLSYNGPKMKYVKLN